MPGLGCRGNIGQEFLKLAVKNLVREGISMPG
jgi:hypothetical protein